MAGFGSIAGGAGGFGASYPTRVGMPNSQAVDYLRPQEEWQAEWDARYQAEAGRARAPSLQMVEDRSAPPPAPDPYGPDWEQLFPGRPKPPMPTNSPDDPLVGQVVQWPTVERYDPGYTPDFSALNAEKEQMMGRYDAQGRNQQAYDIMSGGNQINGIIGPEYTNPNFGRITGAQPQTPNPEDMQWADGLYNATGTYSTAPGRTQGWSLW